MQGTFFLRTGFARCVNLRRANDSSGRIVAARLWLPSPDMAMIRRTFTKFTHSADGLAVHVRTSRVQAFVASEEGGTRIFLNGSLSVLVAEDVDQVRRHLTGPASPEDG